MLTETSLELRQQVTSNHTFISYGLKQGHIRVLHKHSTERVLLKAHVQAITGLKCGNARAALQDVM